VRRSKSNKQEKNASRNLNICEYFYNSMKGHDPIYIKPNLAGGGPDPGSSVPLKAFFCHHVPNPTLQVVALILLPM
jgi:hypothetical protein